MGKKPVTFVRCDLRVLIGLLLVVFCTLWAASGCGDFDNDIDGLPGAAVGQVPVPPGDPSSLALSDEERTQALAATMEFLESSPPSGSDEDLLALARFLAGRPEFSGSSISLDGSVWAGFTDGQLLVVANNRAPAAATAEARGLPVPLRKELPVPPGALLSDTFPGSNLFVSMAPTLESPLAAAGYGVVEGGDVEDLRNSGELGLLYVDAHGADADAAANNNVPPSEGIVRGLVLKQRPPSMFALWTATRATPELDERYRDDLAARRLTHFIAPYTIENEVAVYERRYGITAGFVQQHLRFGENSFVFVNACSSNARDFREACLAAGATAYAGWTLSVGDETAIQAAQHVFEEMLLDGDRSPQTLPEVHRTLVDQGLDLDAFTGSRLVITTLPDGFGMLTPSVRSVTTNESTDLLRLDGVFGTRVGRVLVDGVETPLREDWDPHRLQCELPDVGSTVKVEVAGRHSNTKPIPGRGRGGVAPADVLGVYSGTHTGLRGGATTPSPGSATVDVGTDRLNAWFYDDQGTPIFIFNSSGAPVVTGSSVTGTGRIYFCDNCFPRGTGTFSASVTQGDSTPFGRKLVLSGTVTFDDGNQTWTIQFTAEKAPEPPPGEPD